MEQNRKAVAEREWKKKSQGKAVLDRREGDKHMSALLSHYEKVYRSPKEPESMGTTNASNEMKQCTPSTVRSSSEQPKYVFDPHTMAKTTCNSHSPKSREYLSSTFDDLMYGTPEYKKET
ncbi:hypothetical protein WA538_004778, partial [Blastocystis sp. DL]